MTEVRKKFLKEQLRRGDTALIADRLGLPYNTVYATIRDTRNGSNHDLIWKYADKIVTRRIRKENQEAITIKKLLRERA